MKEIQQLRCIALKLGVSGTALPITETRLYKGSYGFVKLQVYAPKTQNTEAPVCTAFCTTTDELGREKVSSRNHNLMYIGEFDLEGKAYLLFESLLPKEFTQKETSPNGLKITFNYFDTAVTTDERGEIVLNESGVPKRHATDLLVSSVYTTTVYPGGWNEEDVELNINSAAAAQINENTRNISEMQDDILGLQAEDRTIKNDLAKEVERASESEEALDEKIGELLDDVTNLEDSLVQEKKYTANSFEQLNKAVTQLEKETSDAASIAEVAKNTADRLEKSIAQSNSTAEAAKTAAETAAITANEAKTTADNLNNKIDDANDISQSAMDIANEAVKDIANYKSNTDENIGAFKQSITQQAAQFEQSVKNTVEGFESEISATIGDFKEDVVSEVDIFKSGVAQNVADFEESVNNKLNKLEEQVSDSGTIVKVGGESKKEVAFDSDPQEQLDGKATVASGLDYYLMKIISGEKLNAGVFGSMYEDEGYGGFGLAKAKIKDDGTFDYAALSLYDSSATLKSYYNGNLSERHFSTIPDGCFRKPSTENGWQISSGYFYTGTAMGVQLVYVKTSNGIEGFCINIGTNTPASFTAFTTRIRNGSDFDHYICYPFLAISDMGSTLKVRLYNCQTNEFTIVDIIECATIDLVPNIH